MDHYLLYPTIYGFWINAVAGKADMLLTFPVPAPVPVPTYVGREGLDMARRFYRSVSFGTF